MDKGFNLIKSSSSNLERRTFPRFPISTMTFKNAKNSIFEVVDISSTGMQIRKRDGEHEYRLSDKFGGEIHWRGIKLKCCGQVQWIGLNRLGVSFNQSESFNSDFNDFISPRNIISHMRPLHLSGSIGGELPLDLSCWLQADGPVEFFVWCHRNGEVSKVQIILFQKFLEWTDGSKVTEGRIIENRNMETPLSLESEMTIGVGNSFLESDYILLREILEKVPDHFIKDSHRNLLKRILS